jgi:ankyrin repeat protein
MGTFRDRKGIRHFEESALMAAVCAQDLSRLRHLIQEGIDLSQQDSKGRTALMRIAGEPAHPCRTEMATLLLDAGAPVNSRDRDRCSALSWAAHSGNSAMIELLLDRGADIRARDWRGATPLLTAVAREDVRALTVLLNRGAPVDGVLQPKRITGLMIAAENNAVEIARVLLDKGARIDMQDAEGNTALRRAVERGAFGTVKLLLERGVDRVDAEAARERFVRSFHRVQVARVMAEEFGREFTEDDDLTAELVRLKMMGVWREGAHLHIANALSLGSDDAESKEIFEVWRAKLKEVFVPSSGKYPDDGAAGIFGSINALFQDLTLHGPDGASAVIGLDSNSETNG